MDKNLEDITVEELKKEIDNGKALEWEIWTKATQLEKENKELLKETVRLAKSNTAFINELEKQDYIIINLKRYAQHKTDCMKNIVTNPLDKMSDWVSDSKCTCGLNKLLPKPNPLMNILKGNT